MLGETYNGHLVNCDSWMNINLREVIVTSADTEKFWRVAEIYIKGNTIKHLRIPDQVIDMVRKDQGASRSFNRPRGRGRGGKQQSRGDRPNHRKDRG